MRKIKFAISGRSPTILVPMREVQNARRRILPLVLVCLLLVVSALPVLAGEPAPL